jgi:hypothetical protein
MRTARPLILIVPTVLIACAQAVSQDLVDDEGEGASGPSTGGAITSSGGKTNATGGKTGMSTAGKGGTGTQAFGGTSSNGGSTDTGEGGEDTGGTGGGSTAGSGGQASAGGGGTSSGVSGGTGGSSGSGGGGGTGQVGKGDCAGTPVFEAGAQDKYAKDALVVAVCMGGTTCTQEIPPLEQGKQYEFKCLDEFNCGRADTNPATTNWAVPCWKVTRACE